MITVFGEGKVFATPDRAIITVGVITESKDLAAAQQESNEKMNAIIDSLIRIGIPREHIKTSEFRIETQYDYVEGKQIFRGYKIIHLLQVTTNQITMIGRIVDTAVAVGANAVSNIQFSVADPALFYNQALSLALTNSRQKAETLAQTMGVTLLSAPFEIQEQSHTAPQPNLYRASTPIQPGELEIVARIIAKYHYA